MSTLPDTAFADAYRVSTARLALNSAAASRGDLVATPDEAVVDLLVDLQHFCAARRIDFRRCADIAALDYASGLIRGAS